MKSLLTIAGEEIPVRPSPEHEWLLESKLVAEGYGVKEHTIHMAKKRHAIDLIEGKHWVIGLTDCESNNPKNGRGTGSKKTVLYTRRGVVRLGFMIRSERARLFRDLAEDLILHVWEGEINSLSPRNGLPRKGLRRSTFVAHKTGKALPEAERLNQLLFHFDALQQATFAL